MAFFLAAAIGSVAVSGISCGLSIFGAREVNKVCNQAHDVMDDASHKKDKQFNELEAILNKILSLLKTVKSFTEDIISSSEEWLPLASDFNATMRLWIQVLRAFTEGISLPAFGFLCLLLYSVGVVQRECFDISWLNNTLPSAPFLALAFLYVKKKRLEQETLIFVGKVLAVHLCLFVIFWLGNVTFNIQLFMQSVITVKTAAFLVLVPTFGLICYKVIMVTAFRNSTTKRKTGLFKTLKDKNPVRKASSTFRSK